MAQTPDQQQAILDAALAKHYGKENPSSYPPDMAGMVNQPAGPYAKRVLAENMPAILGTIATLPFGGEGAWPMIAARIAAGGIGSGAGSMAGDVMQGQNPDLRKAGFNAALGTGAGAVGEGLNAVGNKVAGGLTKGWLRPTPAAIEDSPTLVEDVLKSRARYRGPKSLAEGGKGGAEPFYQMNKSMQAKRDLLARTPTATIGSEEPLASVLAERDAIARSSPTDERLSAIDAFISSFRKKWGTRVGPEGAVTEARIPVSRADELKSRAYREATFTENESPTQKFFNRQTGLDTRAAVGRALPSNTVSPGVSEVGSQSTVPHQNWSGGKGYKPGIGYNEQDAMTHRMHSAGEAVRRAATLSHAPGLGGHLGALGTAGAIGGAMHSPQDASAAYILSMLLNEPHIANNVALGLTSPVTRFLLRQGPRAAQSSVGQ